MKQNILKRYTAKENANPGHDIIHAIDDIFAIFDTKIVSILSEFRCLYSRIHIVEVIIKMAPAKTT